MLGHTRSPIISDGLCNVVWIIWLWSCAYKHQYYIGGTYLTIAGVSRSACSFPLAANQLIASNSRRFCDLDSKSQRHLFQISCRSLLLHRIVPPCLWFLPNAMLTLCNWCNFCQHHKKLECKYQWQHFPENKFDGSSFHVRHVVTHIDGHANWCALSRPSKVNTSSTFPYLLFILSIDSGQNGFWFRWPQMICNEVANREFAVGLQFTCEKLSLFWRNWCNLVEMFWMGCIWVFNHWYDMRGSCWEDPHKEIWGPCMTDVIHANHVNYGKKY